MTGNGFEPSAALRIRLELASVPRSVGLVRSVIRTVARADELDRDLVEDMRSAVSEACNNVVLHAYPGTPGPLIFSLAVQGEWIEAVVRDQGCGIRPEPGRNRGLGMGVTLINSLADRAEFESSELGTEVRMRFRQAARPPEPLDNFSPAAWTLTDQQSSGALPGQSD
jgi:anti-sigma regulatory factor (Ser/Thr protein kinase)